jgi:hypothetical protein
MAVTARGEAMVSSLNKLAIKYALLAAKRELEEQRGRAEWDCLSEPQ